MIPIDDEMAGDEGEERRGEGRGGERKMMEGGLVGRN